VEGSRAVAGSEYVQEYQELTRAAHDAGLMRRRHGLYWAMMFGTVIAMALIVWGVVTLGHSWYQLILAGLLGVVMGQLGFLGHEAAHREIFRSTGWNEWVGRILSGLFAGLSYEWWLAKHNTHHSNPNKFGVDPDITSTVLTFTPEASDSRPAWAERFTKRQGFYFLPLLCFEGFFLHYTSIKTVLTAPKLKHRWVEILLIGVRLIGYVVFLFAVMSPGQAAAFIGVQVAVFGFLLGAAFAPNHIGMPTVPHDAEIDFLRRQVMMSRNVRGGFLVHFFMGGLEYQVEHHLFPDAPRPNLHELQRMTRQYCADHNVTYTETSLREAFGTLLTYLNQVGLKNRDPFTCPLVRQYRG
jgi:fatty acid desaturase